ncbi:MAG: shikimate kinase [Thermaerobacter sp.]|nr:shikimate kinase [Thermaerobacter sp.]
MCAASKPHLLLIGMMGAGKSTIGRCLAERLGWTFADLDEAIVAADGRSVARIFAEDGEERFRLLESAALAALLAGPRSVIALGGGAPATPENRAPVAGQWTVWLDAAWEVLWERVAGSGRPLAVSPGGFRALWEERRPIYQDLARWRLAVDAISPAEAARRIAGWMDGQGGRGGRHGRLGTGD